MSDSTNKRIAKNAVLLSFRMVLVTIVGLFTTRYVVEALGVADYGIYGVIGGVVGMAAFLNSSMAGATTRFITFALGKGDAAELKQVFSTALLIHILIAIIVTILAETVGLWFVNNKMNFPEGSIRSVNILYQFTIVSMFFSFTQVPYSADIMAHEKMGIYAYFAILNVMLKLGIVLSLFLFGSNRLVWYAFMLLLLSIITQMLYRWYCVKHFEEARFTFKYDKQIAKDMGAFSGYDIYGNMCNVALVQGQPVILNIFFGVIVNAASNFALTISGSLGGLSGGIFSAFRPQIIKNYAASRFSEMCEGMRRSGVFTLLILGCLCIPFYLGTDVVLWLWLGMVPEYTVDFFRLIIVTSCLNYVMMINNSAIHATGDIRRISFVNGTLLLLCPVLSYIVLKLGYLNPNIIYEINIIFYLGIMALGFYFIRIQIPQINLRHYVFPILKSILTIIACIVLCFCIKDLLSNSIHIFSTTIYNKILILSITSIIGIALLIYSNSVLVLNKGEREFLNSKIKVITDKFKMVR